MTVLINEPAQLPVYQVHLDKKSSCFFYSHQQLTTSSFTGTNIVRYLVDTIVCYINKLATECKWCLFIFKYGFVSVLTLTTDL